MLKGTGFVIKNVWSRMKKTLMGYNDLRTSSVETMEEMIRFIHFSRYINKKWFTRSRRVLDMITHIQLQNFIFVVTRI